MMALGLVDWRYRRSRSPLTITVGVVVRALASLVNGFCRQIVEKRTCESASPPITVGLV
jgi:hypothetical protein